MRGSFLKLQAHVHLTQYGSPYPNMRLIRVIDHSASRPTRVNICGMPYVWPYRTFYINRKLIKQNNRCNKVLPEVVTCIMLKIKVTVHVCGRRRSAVRNTQ